MKFLVCLCNHSPARYNMASRPRAIDIRNPATYVFPGITLGVTVVLSVLYARYESVATATAMCISLFLFVAEPRLETAMPEHFQIQLLPIWIILTFWLLYGTEAPENHFHSLGEMTLRDIAWVALVITTLFRGLGGGSRNILRTATMVLVGISLFLPTEASVATLMPPWALSVKIGLTILLYMALQLRERVRPRSEIQNRTAILNIVTFQCLSPLFLHMAFLVVPAALLINVVWSILSIARDRRRMPRVVPVEKPEPEVVHEDMPMLEIGPRQPAVPSFSVHDFPISTWAASPPAAAPQAATRSANLQWSFVE